jgi:predicted transglutaminase-like protease
MADKLAAVAQQITGDLVNTVAEQANTAITDATVSVSKDKAQSMGDIIANHTCDILNTKVPNIVSSVTNQILNELHEKINSEQFTTDFINVLQTKLLQDKTYSEPFLTKFDNLFDMIIKEAKDRHDRKEFEQTAQQGAGNHKKTKKLPPTKRKKTRRVRFL